MIFERSLISGTLIRRYKRFLADVELDDGRILTAHTPNTGSMAGLTQPGSRVWLLDSQSETRKYPFTWELVEALPNVIVGINTHRTNGVVEEAIRGGRVASLMGYSQIRREVRYGEEKSRIDLLLEEKGRPSCYVEVKNVTLVRETTAYFPDAVTARGTKHLRELMAMVKQGHRAVIFFGVQRRDATEVRPADSIDPLYGETLREALSAGVEAMAMGANPSPQGIVLDRTLPVTVGGSP